MRNLYICILTLLIMTSSVLLAEDLTRIGIDARGQGMGRSISALVGDNNAAIVNPAGLASVSGVKISSMYMKYYEDVTYIVAGISAPAFDGVLSGRCISIRVDDITRTFRETDPLKIKPWNPEFPDLSRIEAAGTFGYFSNIYAASYARKLNDQWSIGLTTKVFHNKMETFSSGNAIGVDADVGVLYRASDIPLTASLVFRNFIPGPNIYWSTGTGESVPLSVIAGSAYKVIPNMLVTVECTYENAHDGLFLFKAGTEYNLIKELSLRAGCYELHDKPYIKHLNYSIGAGLAMSGISFDYAFKPDLELNYNHLHFFSMGIDFN